MSLIDERETAWTARACSKHPVMILNKDAAATSVAGILGLAEKSDNREVAG
jgi:hypothetical protein